MTYEEKKTRKDLGNICVNLGVPRKLWWLFMDKSASYDALKMLSVFATESSMFDMDYTGLCNSMDIYTKNKDGSFKYFDSCGHYGMNSRVIMAAWYKSGCGINIQYFYNIIKVITEILDKQGVLETACEGIFLLPNKYLSMTQIHKYIQVCHDSSKRGLNLSKRLLSRMITLSYLDREIVYRDCERIKDNSNACEPNWRTPRFADGEYKYNYFVIGHNRVDWSLLKMPIYKKVQYAPIKYQWYWIFTKFGYADVADKLLSPLSYNDTNISSPITCGLGKKSIAAIVKFSNSFDKRGRVLMFDAHSIYTMINVYTLVGNDIKAGDEILANINYSGLLGSVLTTPLTGLTKDQLSLVKSALVRNNEYLEHASMLVRVVVYLNRMPVSIKETLTIGRSITYDNIKDRYVSKIAADCGLDQSSFEVMQNHNMHLIKKGIVPKTIPSVTHKQHGYTMSLLEPADPRGWVLGEYTNCCQSLGDAGSSCAKSGMNDKDKGFLIVTNENGDIYAQSWVWTTTNGKGLVLDSVESKGLTDVVLEKVSNIIKEWANKVVDTTDVKHVYIGNTTYGITKRISKLIRGSKEEYNKKPIHYNGYMDGKIQYRIV